MIELEGKVKVDSHGIFSFEGPQAKAILNMFELEISRAKQEGKSEVALNLIRAVEVIANKL